MPGFEYKVVAAPRKGVKAKGASSPEDRFAHALATVMNEQAKDGWEYLRTDTLPMEERKGLTGKRTVYQNMLVFRRTRPDVSPSVKVTAIAGPDSASATPRLGAPLREVSASTAPALGPATAPSQADETPADDPPTTGSEAKA
jgi:hypothetical protein